MRVFTFLTQYYSELAAAVAVLALVVIGTLGLPTSTTALFVTVALPIIVNVLAISVRLRTHARATRNSLEALASRIESLTRALALNAEGFAKLTEPRRKKVIEVELLETPYDFYRALNRARSESRKTIRVMKLHHLGPQDSDHEDNVIEGSTDNGQSALSEIREWYGGLAEWNRISGRQVERIMTVPTTSMATFRDDARELMRGTTYIEHELPWDGQHPLLNLCVFDNEQITMTFSTRPGENPYKPIPGLRIRSKAIAQFFSSRYYDKLVVYCQQLKTEKAGQER